MSPLFLTERGLFYVRKMCIRDRSRDALLESYDLEIDRLQKIVESWDGITEAIQRAKDMTMAGTILGSGWQDRVTSGDTGDFENVSGQYEKNDREQTWTERQIEENERLIRQVEDYIEAWQMGQITIREAREEINDIVSDVMPEIEANDERVSSPVSYTHLDVYKRQALPSDKPRPVLTLTDLIASIFLSFNTKDNSSVKS